MFRASSFHTFDPHLPAMPLVLAVWFDWKSKEHEVLQRAELSAKLIQSSTSEAPQRLSIPSDWMFTRS